MTVAVSVAAHDEVPEVTVYVKSESARLVVFVRIPIEFVSDARLPVRADGYLDVTALNGALAPVIADATRNLDVMAGGAPLSAPATSWTISVRPDRSFETYERAAARLSEPRPAGDSRIDPAKALIDLKLDFPPASSARSTALRAPRAEPRGAVETDPPLSVRVNGFRLSNRPSQMRLSYLAHDGAARALVTSGEPRRVALDPPAPTVIPLFARFGLEQLTLAALHLWFLFAIAIPSRPLRDVVSLFAAFSIGMVIALAGSAFVPGPPDPVRLGMFQALAAAGLVAAAVQNLTRPRHRWVYLAAIVFGLIDGLVLGGPLRANGALAGSHGLLALVSFAAPILLGSLWLLLIAHPAIALVRRSRLTERWAVILLSAIPLHAGLHGLFTSL
jgi:hypothetical protein